jgi:hypothetical protein
VLDVGQVVLQCQLLASQAFDGQPLDDLILVPHGKLAVLRFHLQEHGTSSQRRTQVIGGQIDIDAAIPPHMPQIHLLIERGERGMRVNPRGQGGSDGQGGKRDRRRAIATGASLLGTFVVGVLEKRLRHLPDRLEGARSMDCSARLSLGAVIPFHGAIFRGAMRRADMRRNSQTPQPPPQRRGKIPT